MCMCNIEQSLNNNKRKKTQSRVVEFVTHTRVFDFSIIQIHVHNNKFMCVACVFAVLFSCAQEESRALKICRKKDINLQKATKVSQTHTHEKN